MCLPQTINFCTRGEHASMCGVLKLEGSRGMLPRKILSIIDCDGCMI